MGKIVKLTPYLSETVWGGAKLAKLKKLDSINPIGETWEVSTLPQGSSSFEGVELAKLASLKYLVKFIDTAANLSIQVHPDDEYASQHENSTGKTECWFIIDAAKDAGIYLGFKNGVTKKEFFTAVENGLAVDHFLNFIPVKRGDFFLLPAGTIHAIGANVTLCEVQQSSGITYRVWDWNRMGLDGKPRELHIEKAKDVANFETDFNQNVLAYKKENLLAEKMIKDVIKHSDFRVQLFSKMDKKFELNLKGKDSLIVLEGSLGGDINLNAYESAIVIESGRFDFEVSGPVSFLLCQETSG